ncbi:VOC family protein [Fictibacillus iocasae]|uniref:VOC family protein n=1 Tax=Fictibacillus iocasae TaxID=2715437 RepID=A0ABW2NM33_9BACL
MIKGIEHTGIMVSDLESSLEFYCGILGLELIDRYMHPSAGVELAFLGLEGKVLVELIGGYPPEVYTEGKVHHVAFLVDHIGEKLDTLRTKGVKLKDEQPIELPTGYYFFFYGPDGEYLEFFERKQ